MARDFKTDITIEGKKVWYELNDGHESGLDADLLDGKEWQDVEDGLDGKSNLHGFPIPYEVTLAYSGVNRQLTITPIGATFDIWVGGVRITKTGVQTSTAHANTTGNYYITYDATGTLNVSTQVWDILDPTAIPVCALYYNADLQDAFALFELHTAIRNVAAHSQQHLSIGTFVANITHFSLSGFTLDGNTNAAVTYGVSSGTIYDEDIKFDISSLADNGPYTILRRTGATTWTWTTNNTVPYLVNSGTNSIQRNGAVGGLYNLQDVNNNNYVNYYLFASSMIDPAKRLFLIPSQIETSSATEAAAESVESLSLGDLPIVEFVPIWKITYRRQSPNGSTGRARLIAITRLGGSRSSALSFSGASGSHNSLSGRSDADCHPATAISFTPYQYGTATEVGGALNQIIDKTLNQSLANIKDNDPGYIPHSNGFNLVTDGGLKYNIFTDTLEIISDNAERAIFKNTSTSNQNTSYISILSGVSASSGRLIKYGSEYNLVPALTNTFSVQSLSCDLLLRAANTGYGMKFLVNGSATAVAEFKPTGNLLIGTANDDGVNKLQVEGKIACSAGYIVNGNDLAITHIKTTADAGRIPYSDGTNLTDSADIKYNTTNKTLEVTGSGTGDARTRAIFKNSDTSTQNVSNVFVMSGASTAYGAIAKYGSEYTVVPSLTDHFAVQATSCNLAIRAVTAGYSIKFLIGATNRMEVRSDGVVTVNRTTDDATGAQLQVNGAVSLTDDLIFANRLTTDGHIHLYAGSSSGGYAIGVEDSTLYYRSGNIFRWYINNLADGGSSDRMSLTTTELLVGVSGGVRITNLAGVGNRLVRSTSTGVLTNSASDERLKRNISTLNYGLWEVQKLNPVSFQWIDTDKMGSERDIGLIAQEVQQVVPEVVGENYDGTLSLDYEKLVPVLINAIKELKNEIEELKKQHTSF
jgi:hypothetical protein